VNEIILFVGGTDPSGGAGLPADMKTASTLGFHSYPVVSAITVQNSGNVLSWSTVNSEKLLEQLRAVCDDGSVGGVKSGMLGSEENVTALAGFIRENLKEIPYVLDPVLAAGGGTALANSDMPELLKNELIPLCALCTPNISEAEALTGITVECKEDMIRAGRTIMGFGAKAVLVKGGHLSGNPVDILVTESGHTEFSGSRITHENVHGTGCTLAAAAAAFLSAGFTAESSVRNSIRFVRRVITRRIKRVHGNLPGHFPEAGPPPSYPDGSAFYLPPVFCSMCGEPLGKLPGENGHLFCRKCGYIHYRNPIPAVALMVHDTRRILLVKRAIPPGKGKFSLPGGFLETGETVTECGYRELFEETALRAKESRLMELETDMTAYGGILLAVLEVTAWEGAPVAGDDASEVVWSPLDRVPELAFSAHNRLVEKFVKTL